MTNLIEVLKEQASFGFTGKVNLLSKDTDQFLGVIYLQEGIMVGAAMNELRGKKALLRMVFDDVDGNQNFKFIVEPEILDESVLTMRLKFEEIRKLAQEHYGQYQESKKLRPAPHLNLVIDPTVVVSKDELSPEEFDVLSTLTEWSKVSDIYKYSKLMDYELTMALVSLRKKKAIKVFQN